MTVPAFPKPESTRFVRPGEMAPLLGAKPLPREAPRPAAKVARAFRELLVADHVGFATNFHFLAGLAENNPGHVFADAALELVRARVNELRDIEEALEALHAVASDPRVEALLAPDRPLSAFLKGLYVFCEVVVEAFSDVALAAPEMRIDWVSLKAKVVEASHFYFEALVPAIRDEVKQVPIDAWNVHEPLRTFSEDLEELFFVAGYMNKSLAKVFVN